VTFFRINGIVIYLLDTSAISALMREDSRMLLWLASLQSDDRLITCTIVRGEILFGLERLPKGQRRTVLDTKAKSVLTSLPCESVPPIAGDR
jgi:predicted nucleic acid-binding protein